MAPSRHGTITGPATEDVPGSVPVGSFRSRSRRSLCWGTFRDRSWDTAQDSPGLGEGFSQARRVGVRVAPAAEAPLAVEVEIVFAVAPDEAGPRLAQRGECGRVAPAL